MLRIICDGELLDLDSDIKISLVFENPMLSDDRIPAPYSLTYELPLTPSNRRILGYPERPTTKSGFQSRYTEISFNGIVFARGVQSIDEISDKITANFNGAVFPDNIRLGLHEQTYRAIPLGKAELSLQGTYSNRKILETYNDYFKSSTSLNEEKVIAPTVAIRGNEWPNKGYYRQVLSNFINMYDSSRGYSLGETYRNSVPYGNILPAFHIGWLLDHLLPGLITNNFFNTDSNEWYKLHLQSMWHPAYQIKKISPIYDYDRDTQEASLRLADFMPSIPANDFIREILKLPCATLFIKDDQYIIEFNKDVLSRKIIHDINQKVIGIPSVKFEKGKKYGYGYNVEYGSIPADRTLTEVATIGQMLADAEISSYTDESELRTYKIIYSGQVIEAEFDENSVNKCRFTVLYQDMGGSKIEDTATGIKEMEEFDNVFNGEVLRTNLRHIIVYDSDNSPFRQFYYVPETDPIGSSRPTSLVVGLAHGYRNSVNASAEPYIKYPYMSHCNRDAHGIKLGNLSLQYDGEDGLMNQYHKEFRDWISMDKHRLAANVIFSVFELSKLDLRDKYYYKGVKYLIDTMTVTIKHDRIEPAEVEFIEVPDVLS